MNDVASINNLMESNCLSSATSYKYEKLPVTVDILLFTLDEIKTNDVKRLPEKELKILLNKRTCSPFINECEIPGYFIDINESVDEAAYKSIKEKANIDNIYIEQLYTLGEVNRDPSSRVISTSYLTLVNKDDLKEYVVNDEEELLWFSINKELIEEYKTQDDEIIKNYVLSLISNDRCIKILYNITEVISFIGFNKNVSYKFNLKESSNSKLAFDHVKLLSYALERISNKVEYTTIAFSLLSNTFTLTELQKVYELLLGRNLTKSNFRRWISKVVEETDYTKREGSYRPSKLYKLNKKLVLKGFTNI